MLYLVVIFKIIVKRPIYFQSKFDSTSRFARLQRIFVRMEARKLYLRFESITGDAMGMNMVSNATEFTLKHLSDEFPDMEILTLSSNMCTDKKPSAINWVMGRGKSVVAEAVVPRDVVEKTLKTTAANLVDINNIKNKTGMHELPLLIVFNKREFDSFLLNINSSYFYRISNGWKYRWE